MSSKSNIKSARLMALGYAIQEGYFDPDTVNMSDIAEVFCVHRGTIMRDLREVQAMLDTAKEYQTVLRNASLGESKRKQ